MNKKFHIEAVILLLIATLHIPGYANADDVDPLDSLRQIVFDKHISLQERYEAVFKADFPVDDTPIYQHLRKDAMKAKDFDIVANTYVKQALWSFNYTEEGLQQMAIFLDSVQPFLSKVKDERVLGNYYRAKAYQLDNSNIREVAYYNYKAINYYKQPEDNLLILGLLYDISTTTNDTTILAKNRAIAKEIKPADALEGLLFHLISSSYFALSRSATAKDSSIYHQEKEIECYQKAQENGNAKLSPGMLPLLYYNLAQDYASTTNPDFSRADSCVRAGDELCQKDDSTTLIIAHFTRALILFERGKYHEAEHELNTAKAYQEGMNNSAGTIVNMNFVKLSINIYTALGNYKKALEYEFIKEELINEEKDRNLEEIESVVKIEKKEKELASAQITLKNQKRIKYLVITILGLVLASLIFLLFWIRIYRKRVNERAAMLRLQKKEAEIQAQLKEEEASNAELEKYEILSHYHLKELELTNKDRELTDKSETLDSQNKELDELRRSHEELEKFVDAYKTKLEAYETEQEGKTLNNSHFTEVLRQELKQMLISRPKIQFGARILQELDMIDDNFIYELKSRCQKKLSVLHLKYCICFALKMTNEQVAHCFFIEPASVRTTRHRLKKSFGLGVDDDFEVFLRHLAFNDTDNHSARIFAIR